MILALNGQPMVDGLPLLSPCSVGRSLSRPLFANCQADAGKGSKQKNFSAALGEKIFCALAG